MEKNEVVIAITHGGDCPEVASTVVKSLEASHLCYSTDGNPDYKIVKQTTVGDRTKVVLRKKD